VSYAQNHRIRVDTPAELAAAKARERDFLEVVLPAVRNHAANVFRRWSLADSEEAMANITALALKYFVRNIANGHDPLTCIGYMAKVVVKGFRGFQRVTGKMSGTDAMSLRTQMDKDLTIVAESQTPKGVEAGGWEGFLYSAGGKPADPAAASLDFQEWKAGLPAGLQKVVTLLAEQNDLADVAARLDLTPATVQGLRDNLADRYLAFLRG
jgi:hypothetical protein